MTTPLLFDPSGAPVRSPGSNVVDLTEKGAIVLSHFHIIAQRLNWSIRCERCGEAIQGHNRGTEAYLVVQCGCTEYRAEISAAGRIRLG